MRDGQHQVGGGNAFFELTAEFETHHFRDQHRHRLAEHRRFRFDTAHAPAQYAKAVNHGGVRVGPHQRIGEGVRAAVFFLGPDRAAQVLQVDLMADAGARRYDAEIVKSTLAPAQKRITFAVALHLDINVLFKGTGAGEFIDHH